MYPNAPNIRFFLLKLEGVLSSIGTKKLKQKNKKEVTGICFSVTSKEFYENKTEQERVDIAIKIQSFLYDGSSYALVKGEIYRIERTYHSGMFVELYLRKTSIPKEEVLDEA